MVKDERKGSTGARGPRTRGKIRKSAQKRLSRAELRDRAARIAMLTNMIAAASHSDSTKALDLSFMAEAFRSAGIEVEFRADEPPLQSVGRALLNEIKLELLDINRPQIVTTAMLGQQVKR